MSRAYDFSITVKEYDDQKVDAIEKACGEGGFHDFEIHCSELSSFLSSALCGGESEDEYVDRVTHAIWSANEAYCVVDLKLTCLEYIPSEIFQLDIGDYEEWKAAGYGKPRDPATKKGKR